MSRTRPSRRRLSKGGLLLFVLALTGAPAAGQESSLEKGLTLLREGRYGPALDEFSRFKQERPEDPRGHHFSGLALAAAGRDREAASEFAAAARLDPDRLEYRLAAAGALAKLRQFESALAQLEPYDGDNLPRQTNPLLLWLLADLHYQRKRNPEALRVLLRLAEVQPGDLPTQIRIGRIHLLEGRHEDALRVFQKAVEDHPESGEALQGLGLSLAGLGKTAEALGALRRAVDAAPQDPTYLLDLGKLLLGAGEAVQAVAVLERAATQPTAPPETFYELSRACRRAGDAEKAAEYLERFQTLDRQRQQKRVLGKRLEGLLKTAQDRLQEGKVQDARDAFAAALRLDPDNWIAHGFLAKIYLSSNRLPDAATHLFEMQRIDPESVEGNYLLATYWYRLGDFQRALESALRAKGRRPDYADLRNLLGNIHFSMGRMDEAKAEYAAAVALEPDREEFRRNLEAAGGGGG